MFVKKQLLGKGYPVVLHTATTQQIREGLVADVCFEWTAQTLKAKGIDKEVRAEFIAKRFPSHWPRVVFAGVEACLDLMRDLPIKVRMMLVPFLNKGRRKEALPDADSIREYVVGQLEHFPLDSDISETSVQG